MMTLKIGKIQLFKFSTLSLVEILFLLYISSIIIISMMPVGNIISKGFGLLFLFYFFIFYVFWLKGKIYVSKELTFILLWLLFCLISGFFATKIDLVVSKLVTIFQLILFFIAGYSVIIQGKITEKHIFYTFILSMVIVIVYGVSTYEPISGFAYKNRIASTAGNPNTLAVFGSFAYIFTLYLLGNEKKLLKYIFLFLILMILVYGIIKTHSRQGLVLISVSTIIYLSIRLTHNFTNTLNKRKFILKTVLISFGILSLLFVGFRYLQDSSYYFRIQTLLSFMKMGVNSSSVNLAKIIDYSAYERSQFIIYGFKIWLDNLFFGVGLDNFRVVIKQYWPISNPLYSHNNYIELLSTIGTFGMLAYYSIYYLVIKRLINLLKTPLLTSQQIKLIHTFLTAIISLMVVELVTVSYYRKYTWVILLIIIGVSDRLILRKKLQHINH